MPEAASRSGHKASTMLSAAPDTRRGRSAGAAPSGPRLDRRDVDRPAVQLVEAPRAAHLTRAAVPHRLNGATAATARPPGGPARPRPAVAQGSRLARPARASSAGTSSAWTMIAHHLGPRHLGHGRIPLGRPGHLQRQRVTGAGHGGGQPGPAPALDGARLEAPQRSHSPTSSPHQRAAGRQRAEHREEPPGDPAPGSPWASHSSATSMPAAGPSPPASPAAPRASADSQGDVGQLDQLGQVDRSPATGRSASACTAVSTSRAAAARGSGASGSSARAPSGCEASASNPASRPDRSHERRALLPGPVLLGVAQLGVDAGHHGRAHDGARQLDAAGRPPLGQVLDRAGAHHRRGRPAQPDGSGAGSSQATMAARSARRCRGPRCPRPGSPARW